MPKDKNKVIKLIGVLIARLNDPASSENEKEAAKSTIELLKKRHKITRKDLRDFDKNQPVNKSFHFGDEELWRARLAHASAHVFTIIYLAQGSEHKYLGPKRDVNRAHHVCLVLFNSIKQLSDVLVRDFSQQLMMDLGGGRQSERWQKIERDWAYGLIDATVDKIATELYNIREKNRPKRQPHETNSLVVYEETPEERHAKNIEFVKEEFKAMTQLIESLPPEKLEELKREEQRAAGNNEPIAQDIYQLGAQFAAFIDIQKLELEKERD